MLIFVTGVAGSGKSTLCVCLSGRGIAAVDADEGISRHVRVSDGTSVATPPRFEQSPGWAARHEFRFDMARVEALASRATAEAPLVLLGAAYGDDEVIAMADRSFYLDIGEAELRRRLAARGPGGYGSAPHELEPILEWHALAARRYEALGATRLDGEAPAADIAAALLSLTGQILSSAGPEVV